MPTENVACLVRMWQINADFIQGLFNYYSVSNQIGLQSLLALMS